MKYTVLVKNLFGEVQSAFPMNVSREEAEIAAYEKASLLQNLVYVTWYRPEDGQVGYLNRNGDHDMIGKPW